MLERPDDDLVKSCGHNFLYNIVQLVVSMA
jgi:hypothetical protein